MLRILIDLVGGALLGLLVAFAVSVLEMVFQNVLGQLFGISLFFEGSAFLGFFIGSPCAMVVCSIGVLTRRCLLSSTLGLLINGIVLTIVAVGLMPSYYPITVKMWMIIVGALAGGAAGAIGGLVGKRGANKSMQADALGSRR